MCIEGQGIKFSDKWIRKALAWHLISEYHLYDLEVDKQCNNRNWPKGVGSFIFDRKRKRKKKFWCITERRIFKSLPGKQIHSFTFSLTLSDVWKTLDTSRGRVLPLMLLSPGNSMAPCVSLNIMSQMKVIKATHIYGVVESNEDINMYYCIKCGFLQSSAEETRACWCQWLLIQGQVVSRTGLVLQELWWSRNTLSSPENMGLTREISVLRQVFVAWYDSLRCYPL